MKRLFSRTVAAVGITAALAAGPVVAAEPVNPRTMTFAPIKYEIPKAERFTLANGMVAYLMTDRELPLVNITAYVGTGSIYEPAEKIGLAGLTAAVMRSGGIEGSTPEQLDAELEFMASGVESSIGADLGNVSLATLGKNFNRTLELFAGVMMKPAFNQARFDLAIRKSLEALRRQNDDPKGVADRELRKAIYAGNPLGRYPTPLTVKTITRDDLITFHRKYFHPNNIILAVSGDIGRQELEEKLIAVFGSWKKADVVFPDVPWPNMTLKPEMLSVQKEIDQSVIRMGHIGITKDNPDLYAVRVMDFILGGNGFNSRLMSVIRTKEGLAYNVSSFFDVGRKLPGIFLAETETKSGSTARAMGLMLELMTGMTKEPVTEQELKLARESMINSFVFGFTKTDMIVNQRARLEYYGYPKDFLDNYRVNIARVTRDDVLRVAQKYLHPDQLIKVVVGNDAKFDKPLATFGTVRQVTLESWK
jgi:zinc protease